ncbi:C-type lectin domain family 10 member A-like isoform X2 [Erpetoichthys calabaricus]|nr:C-type lectin domain family 10 member A-like isoform X2 [Erpetoichthys calabaricus]
MDSRLGKISLCLLMGICVLLFGIVITLVQHSLWMNRELKKTQEGIRTLNMSLYSSESEKSKEIALLIGQELKKTQEDIRTLNISLYSNQTNVPKETDHDDIKQTLAAVQTAILNLSQSLQTEDTSRKLQLQTLQNSVGQGSETLKLVKVSVDVLATQFRQQATKNDSKEEQCPLNWQKFQTSCYYFSLVPKSWKDSQELCLYMNSDLVVINSQSENDFITGKHNNDIFWIGLTDETITNTWEWVDGTDYESNFKSWRPGQPDNWTGHGMKGGEDCGGHSGTGLWNDDHCDRLYNFVCEK